MLKYDVSTKDVMDGKYTKQISDVVFEVANQANSHLEMARELNKSLPPRANIALLPAVRLGFTQY